MYLKSLTLKGFKSFADKTKMVFDLAVPYDMTDQRPALKKQIEEVLAQQHGEYLTVIRLDGKA